MLLIMGATDVLVGVGTLALAAATFILAAIAVWQLRESRSERRTIEASLNIAERTFRAQLRPELIGCPETDTTERRVHLAPDTSIEKPLGRVVVGVELTKSNLGLISFDVKNIGAGAAEITRLRAMSLDTLSHDVPAYWEPHPWETAPIIVPSSGTAPVDMLMAPQPPAWFYRHVTESRLRFWVEVTYADLGGVETHTRWFEFWQRPNGADWFIGQVRRSEPQHFSNLPPANPLMDYGGPEEAQLGIARPEGPP